MHKRRAEIAETKVEKLKRSGEEKDMAGLHVADNFELIIPIKTRQIITNRKTSYETEKANAKRTKSDEPIPDLKTALCLAVPDKKADMPLKKLLFGTALRDILPIANPTLERLITDSSRTIVDKVEFSSDDKKKLLPPVVSVRFEITDKKTGTKSELMYRCKIDENKIQIKKITDVNEYKKNYYESSTISSTRVHAPKATGKD